MSIQLSADNANNKYPEMLPDRLAARLRGDMKFFPNEPCINGHLTYYYVSTGICFGCNSLKTKKGYIGLAKRGSNPIVKFIGETCKKCGGQERYTCNGRCTACSYNVKKSKEWAENNKERKKENKRKWDLKNRKKVYVYNSEKAKRIITRTPNWLTENQRLKIREIYENRPDGYDVDHIVPLFGDNVCGLHVHWNMQYLDCFSNCVKNNKLLPEHSNCTAALSANGYFTHCQENYCADTVTHKKKELRRGQVWMEKGGDRRIARVETVSVFDNGKVRVGTLAVEMRDGDWQKVNTRKVSFADGHRFMLRCDLIN